MWTLEKSDTEEGSMRRTPPSSSPIAMRGLVLQLAVQKGNEDPLKV